MALAGVFIGYDAVLFVALSVIYSFVYCISWLVTPLSSPAFF
jgi:hypothetical protein